MEYTRYKITSKVLEEVMNKKRTSVYLALKEKGLKMKNLSEEDLYKHFGINPEILRDKIFNKKPTQ